MVSVYREKWVLFCNGFAKMGFFRDCEDGCYLEKDGSVL